MTAPELTSGTASLARFAAQLRFADIPAPVLRRAEDLLVDWFGSVLAGKGARPVETIAAFARAMGPADGASEVLIDRTGSSAYFAAMVNAAASHVAEHAAGTAAAADAPAWRRPRSDCDLHFSCAAHQKNAVSCTEYVHLDSGQSVKTFFPVKESGKNNNHIGKEVAYKKAAR